MVRYIPNGVLLEDIKSCATGKIHMPVPIVILQFFNLAIAFSFSEKAPRGFSVALE
jgi:hypothetical protein